MDGFNFSLKAEKHPCNCEYLLKNTETVLYEKIHILNNPFKYPAMAAPIERMMMAATAPKTNK